MNTFIEWINQWGQAFLEFNAAMLIQFTLLAALLLSADRWMEGRVRAVLRYGIVALILVKLVVPPSLSLPSSIGYWWKRDTVRSVNPGAPQNSLSVSVPMSEPVLGGEYQSAAPFAPPETSAMTLPGRLFLLWLTGVIILGCFSARQLWRLRKILSESRLADANVEASFARARAIMRTNKRTRLRISTALSTPAVCGLWRPVILLPEALTTVGDREMRAIFVHELAHVRRGDLWVGALQTCLQIVYFHNPLVWLANARIRRVREQAVDEVVLSELGSEAEAYPDLLLRMAQFAMGKTPGQPGLLGMFQNRGSLLGRVQLILDRPISKSGRVGIRWVFIIAGIGLVLLPMGRRHGGPSAAEASNSADATDRRRDNLEASAESNPSIEDFLDSVELRELFQFSHTRKSAMTIKRLLEFPEETSATLIELLKEKPGRDTTFRTKALVLLGQVEPLSPAALEAFIEALRDEDEGVRTRAAESLRSFGTAAAAAVPALMEEARYRNGSAVAALVAIAPESPEVCDLLLDMLNDFSLPNEFRRAVARALGKLSHSRERIVPHLVRAGDDADNLLLRNVVEALTELNARDQATELVRRIPGSRSDLYGPLGTARDTAKKSMAELIEELKSGTIQTRKEVLSAISRRPDKIEALPAMIEELRHAGGGEEIEGFLILTISACGPAAIGALPEFIRELDESKRGVGAAVQAVQNLREAAAPAVPALIKVAQSEKVFLAERAITALGSIGQGARSSIPLLKKAMNGPIPSTRFWAAAALWRIDPDEIGTSLPILLAELKDESSQWRGYSIRMLGEMGPSAHSVVPDLALISRDMAEENSTLRLFIDDHQRGSERIRTEKVFQSAQWTGSSAEFVRRGGSDWQSGAEGKTGFRCSDWLGLC